MSAKDYRGDVAAKILAGFAANPAIFAANDLNGWALVNSSAPQIAAYAVELADALFHANEHSPFPALNLRRPISTASDAGGDAPR